MSAPIDQKGSAEFQPSSTHADDTIEGKGMMETQSDVPQYDQEETTRILRKCDYRILPLLAIPYLLSYLDRSNIGNAKVAGMADDLKLTNQEYNITLMVFFFTYALFEVPSNIVLKLTRPSIWIAILMVSWGTVMTLQGIVRKYGDLIATRTLLGFAEAGFFPASSYLLTTWYCRYELQMRMSIFFSAASLAGAFSGILAYAISKMQGVGGLEGWRWIFILEGMLTVIWGFTVPFLLPDSPDAARFLTQEEKAFINNRLQHDSGTKAGTVGLGEPFQWSYLKDAMLDWKIYLAIIMYWGNSICVYAFSFATPTIIQGLGYSAANAQLLTIPVYVVGCITTLVCSWMADRRKTRWPFVFYPFAVSLVGFIGLLSIPHPRYPGLTYFMLFPILGGIYPAVICVVSWTANNLAPSWKRAIGMALLLTFGNLGGAIGSNIFIAKQAPTYWLGYGLCTAVVVAGMAATLLMRMFLTRINNKRNAMDEAHIRRTYTDQQLMVMGDRSPFFRYVT